MSTQTRLSVEPATSWTLQLSDHTGALAWSPSGDLLAAGSMGGEAVLVDAAGGTARARVADHGLGVLDLAWSPDGERLASAGWDGRVVVVGRDAAPVATLAGSGEARCVAWSPDARLLAAGIRRELVVVDASGAPVLRVPDQPSTITDVAWSADSRRVGVACYGGVRWFEPAKGGAKPARTFDWKGSLLCLHVAPDGRFAASGNQDNSVHVWRLWSGRDMEMTGYPAKIDHIAWHPASRLLAVAGIGDVTVWDFGGSGPEGSVPRQIDAHEDRLSALAYAPDGSLLATAAPDGWVKLWGDSDTTPVAAWQAGSGVACMAWSPDSGAIAVGGEDGRVQRLDLR